MLVAGQMKCTPEPQYNAGHWSRSAKLKQIAAIPPKRDACSLEIDVWFTRANVQPCGDVNSCAPNSGAEQRSEKWAAKGEAQPPGAD